MNAEGKKLNRKNQKSAAPSGHAGSSEKKAKTEISNSFLHRIISLLKREDVV